MTEFEKVMMNRDEMTRSRAETERARAKAAFYDLMEEGASYDDVEEFLSSEYGLEMDYIFDLI